MQEGNFRGKGRAQLSMTSENKQDWDVSGHLKTIH